MAEILCFIVIFGLGFFAGWFSISWSLLRDKRFKKLEPYEVVVHRADLSLLIAAAPRELKVHLAGQKSYEDLKKISDDNLDEEKDF